MFDISYDNFEKKNDEEGLVLPDVKTGQVAIAIKMVLQ